MPVPRPWYPHAYRRAVIDMHIPDWDEKFLSEVRVDQMVQMLVRAKAQSIVAYAMSHVGLFNYPTQVGQQHRGLKGRDLVREILDGCHARDIAVVLYNSLIFDRWAADNHPEWRMKAADGKPHGQGGRHGLVCPNSPYREYVRRWVEEECQRYDFDGIRLDMTFWPATCYCEHCRRRFAAEVGGEIPTTVHWLDERWVAFQRRREVWLAEFAAVATSTVRKLRPTATVEHQSSTYPLHWSFGVNADLIPQNDFLQGDFYGDSWQGSFVRKLLEELTPHRPFGFETSFAVELANHTAMKPAALLEAKAAAAIADNAAFIFIDAIDPIGSLNPAVYERMGSVFDKLLPYYGELGGQRVQDIGVYYSLDSKFSYANSGRSTSSPDTSDAHTSHVMACTRWLAAHHLPFGVITRKSLDKLNDFKVLVLSHINVMRDDEAEAIRRWVAAGGRLYASGWTSIVDGQGRARADFAMADVFGVKLLKPQWSPWPHYVAPTLSGQPLFDAFTEKYPAFAKDFGMEVSALPAARVLATTTLPWPAPDPTRFSSIHSNPPWQPTDRAEVVEHAFGKGQVIYAASPVETIEGLGETFIRLIRRLYDRYSFSAQAPGSVEMTLFFQPDKHRYRLSLVNFQRDLPNIPVAGIPVQLRLPGQRVHRVVQLPENRELKWEARDGVTSFEVPRLETLAMLAIEVC